MGKEFVSVLVVAALLTACGKKEMPPPQAEATPTASAAAPISPDPMVTASLDDLEKKIQAQQYEAAVGALVALNGMPKNDKQRADFNKRLSDVNSALIEKAAQGDQQAMQSQLMLGRMLKGR
jgi:hypothetical protein